MDTTPDSNITRRVHAVGSVAVSQQPHDMGHLPGERAGGGSVPRHPHPPATSGQGTRPRRARSELPRAFDTDGDRPYQDRRRDLDVSLPSLCLSRFSSPGRRGKPGHRGHGHGQTDGRARERTKPRRPHLKSTSGAPVHPSVRRDPRFGRGRPKKGPKRVEVAGIPISRRLCPFCYYATPSVGAGAWRGDGVPRAGDTRGEVGAEPSSRHVVRLPASRSVRLPPRGRPRIGTVAAPGEPTPRHRARVPTY
jgi:hypothetical protein